MVSDRCCNRPGRPQKFSLFEKALRRSAVPVQISIHCWQQHCDSQIRSYAFPPRSEIYGKSLEHEFCPHLANTIVSCRAEDLTHARVEVAARLAELVPG